ncbi:MAG TPA: hypothetical protein DET40_23710 [Lentisphaeria bacterium]|nr:MAG: hypothetical protein A2X45_23925 [Lentisphaerae bacterium GWF2_50_93]HCE46564.1 hypothetical protein [Lentisphaeria bacterium]
MLSKCKCSLTPRNSQNQIIDLVFGGKGHEDKLYIVSPPGSGKTLVGLMAAVRMNVPALVLAPTTAIQSQWIEKTKYFLADDGLPIASVNPSDNMPVTVLTYQALAQAKELDEQDRTLILSEWHRDLVEDGEDEKSANAWLADFEQNNPERFYLSIMRRWKQKRIQGNGGINDSIVNAELARLMSSFRDRGVRLLIFDECHHLVGYWAQVALALVNALDKPRILGLTATPPSADDLSDREIELHKQLLGDIDYCLQAPAFVRDGALAPYQDLAFFTRPAEHELDYIRNCSASLSLVLESLEKHSGKTLSAWLAGEIEAIPEESMSSTLRKRSVFISESVKYLKKLARPVPRNLANFADGELSIDENADLAGRYASKYLLVSQDDADRKLYSELSTAFRPLGYLITEKGMRNCQSTVSRVLALSKSKMDALVGILEEELKNSDLKIRVLVITDFERSSATVAKDASELLTEESGGAVSAMRALTSRDSVDVLDPILVTGQSVIVDDDLLPRFLEEASKWLKERNLAAELELEHDGGFCRIHGSGRDWSTGNYVSMITSLFEKGVTRCLVGTRGLLGEGWDSLTANTLIDLTNAATEMTVNQLRGRAIRLNPAWPEKTSNIWDVVCIAPEFEKGLSDYERFSRKHSNYYGICDDGAIEYGLGHIHPALTEAGPEDVALNAHILNAEMLARCHQRMKARENWKIGEPYENRKVKALEIKAGKSFENLSVSGDLRKMRGYELQTSEKVKNICLAVFESLHDAGLLKQVDSKMKISERSDSYFRIFLDSKDESDIDLFSACIDELFRPLADQRYIIPRWEQLRKDNWLSKMLPEILKKFVMTKENRIAVYHPLPACFADSKKNAELFSDKWNIHVSPGRAIFARRGEGETVLAEAKSNKQSIQDARAKLKSVWK